MVLSTPRVPARQQVAWLFDEALKLVALGYTVIPSGAGLKGKFPLIKWKEFQQRLPTRAELEYWQESKHPRLWGVVTGVISGIVVIDTDDVGARLILEKEGLTPHVLTPRCANFWFKHPGWSVKTVAGVLHSVDVRADRGFVNVIGTRKDGGVYRIVKWPVSENIYPWERLPRVVAEAIGKEDEPQLQPLPVYDHVEAEDALHPMNPDKGRCLTDVLLDRAVASAVDGNRNDRGLWLCCQLRDNRYSRSAAEVVILRYAALVRMLDSSDPYTQDEALRSLEQAYSRPSREPWRISSSNHSKRFTHV